MQPLPVKRKKPLQWSFGRKPILLGSGGYFVKLLVKNPTGSKYAKIEETIPAGYMFEEVDSYNGIVSFAASTVKFIWMKLPEDLNLRLSTGCYPKVVNPRELW